MSLSDLEKEILAEGEKLYAEAKAEALKLRKSHLLAEIEEIEADLAKLLDGKSNSGDSVDPEKAADVESRKPDVPAEAAASEPEQGDEEPEAPVEASEEPQEAAEAPAEDDGKTEDDKS